MSCGPPNYEREKLTFEEQKYNKEQNSKADPARTSQQLLDDALNYLSGETMIPTAHGKFVVAGLFLGLSGCQSVSPQSDAVPQATAKHILGPWQAKLTVPGTASLPSENPVIKCSLLKTAVFSAGYLHLTFTNLSDQSYLVKYVVLGYNKKGERISQGSDEFAILKREKVVRQDFLDGQDARTFNPGSSFVIQLQLKVV
jgi:hypothetical protein